MCTNHDKLHYSPWARHLAETLTMGNREQRDLLLELAGYDGLTAFTECHAAGMCSDRLTVCVRRIKSEYERLVPLRNQLTEQLYAQWSDELDRLMSLPPFAS